MKEMNNVKIKNGLSSLNIPNSIRRENSLQPQCTHIVKESASNYENSVKYEKEQCQNNPLTVSDCKQIIKFDDEDNILLNKDKVAVLEGKKNKFSYTFTEKTIEFKTKSPNNNTIKPFKSMDVVDSTKFVISCRFCRKGFETLEYFSSHDCKKKKNNSQKLHKCKFCVLTFTLKSHLKKHIKSHKRCNICNAQFVTRKTLCKHLKTEHQITEPEKLHHCQFCNKHFPKKQSLNIHLKSHDGHRYFCLKCGFGCNDEDIYNDHVFKHINYECNLCGQRFVRRQQYEQHMMGHERYSCTSCNVTYSTKNLFLRHQWRIHHIPLVEKKHACSVCKKIFLRPKHLQIHQRIHTGEKVAKCFHCEKCFSDKKSLEKHMQTIRHLQCVDTDNGKSSIAIKKPYLCSGCGATFTRQQSLFRHVKIIHFDSQSFKCPYCEYNTKSKTNLNRHIEFHNDTKPFVCEICGSSFRAFATLKQHHAFVHSENREFICDVCNKGFKSKSTLQRHMRIHSENRPYRCHCNKAYKRMSHLKRHMVSAHDMTFKKNEIPIIVKSSNLINASVNNDGFTSLVESLEALSNHSLSDNFSVSSMSNNNVACIEQNNSDTNKNSERKLSTLSESDSNFTNVPSNTKQKLLEKSESNDPKNASVTFASTRGIKTLSMSMLPDSHASVSLDDLNLNLSTNYCNLPSSPLGSTPTENVTPTLQLSITSQDVLSFSSSTDSLIRPHSLPNLNFETHSSNIDSFGHFSLQNPDVPTPIEIPSFLLTGDISSPHITDLNLDGNDSTKQLFGDSDILSLPSYPTNNELNETNCSSEHFFSTTRDVDLWVAGDTNNRLKIYDDDLVTTDASVNATFSNLNSNTNNILSHNLIFSNDSLMGCSLDVDTFNSEFDELSNLC